MAIWIQSLSWTLIYALGQGFLVYASLWLFLKLVPATSARVKHHLSLSALTVLLGWFVITWWQQFHSLTLANEQYVSALQNTTITDQPLTVVEINVNASVFHSLLSSLQFIFPWLSAFYFLGLMLMLVRLSAGMLQLFSMRKTGISEPGKIFDELLISLKNRLHIEGSVRLFISAKAQVPMVIGFLKPIILMPAAAMAQLSRQQLETILLHELVHIKRYDYLVNILQTVVETILFFNPFVWMISAVIRREREHCCDDLVLVHTREPLYYATALAALATNPGTAPDFAVAASGQSNQLFNRIKRIMEMKKNPFSYSRMVAAILIITALSFSAAWLSPSFAQSNKDKTPMASVAPSVQVPEFAVKTNAKEQAAEANERTVYQAESSQLIKRLADDKLINEFTGFVVEKKQNKLFINGKQQPDDIANKYLPLVKQEELSVQVFSFQERMRQHPGTSIIQLLAPATLSSPCVDYTKKKKPGC